MIVVFWIALCTILALIAIFVAAIVRMKRTPRWGAVPTSNLIHDTCNLVVNDDSLKVHVYTSRDFSYPNQLPGLIVLPGSTRTYPEYEHWCAHFALQGFPTACMEKQRERFSSEQLAHFIKQLQQDLDILADDTGKSIILVAFGNAVVPAIHATAKEETILLTCGFGGMDVKEDIAKDAVGRIILAHCADDNIAPVDLFKTNCDLLELEDDDQLLLELGGHGGLSQEAVIAGFFSIRIHQKLDLKYQQMGKRS